MKTLAALLALPLTALLAGAAEPMAHLTEYRGSVRVVRQGRSVNLRPHLPLASGDAVSTGRGLATIVFADATDVRMKPGTRISLVESARGRCIEVASGRFAAAVAGGEERPTVIKALSFVAVVRGGVVEYEVNPDGDEVIAFVKGEGGPLEITTLDPDDGSLVTTLLEPAHRLRVSKQGLPAASEPLERHAE